MIDQEIGKPEDVLHIIMFPRHSKLLHVKVHGLIDDATFDLCKFLVNHFQIEAEFFDKQSSFFSIPDLSKLSLN